MQQDSWKSVPLCTGTCSRYSAALFLSGGKILSTEAATSNHSTMTAITSVIVLLII